MSSTSEAGRRRVRLGVIGLGRAFVLTAPGLRADARVQLVAAYDPHGPALQAFQREFSGRAHVDARALCQDPNVDAVYVASPHELHVEHGLLAARHGKHVLVEKPLALTVAGGERLVAACEAAGVQLIVGPSHSFDAPVLHARKLIAGRAVGRVGMVHALNCTNFLYRPRRPEELDPAAGGVVMAQVVHQVDCVRLLAGGLATRVTARTGSWAGGRSAGLAAPGACSALLDFAGGAFASLTYSGHGHFDSNVWQDGITELGTPAGADDMTRARRALADTPDGERRQKLERGFGAAAAGPATVAHEHFGPLLVMGEHADLRITARGVHVCGPSGERFEACPLRAPRAAVVDALVAAVCHGRGPLQSGRWGLATLEVCCAILDSAASGEPVSLQRQVAVGDSS